MSIKNIVSGMGLAMSIITNLKNAVERNGGTAEDVHSLADPEKSRSIWDQIARIIVGAGPVVRQAFKVCVDYTRTLEEMIKAGKYYRVDDNITQANFPLKGEGTHKVEVNLFHFNRDFVSSEDAIAEMDKKGFRPVTLPELLALGRARPELQTEFPIIALGSRWRSPNGSLCVPVLHRCGAGRGLFLNRFGYGWGWGRQCRFAAVRK